MTRARPTERRRGLKWGRPFEVFAEALLMGFLTVALAVPLVTLLAACHASIRHLSKAIADERPGIRDYLGDFRAAFARSWSLSLAIGLVLVMGVLVDLPLVRGVGTLVGFLFGTTLGVAWIAALVTAVRAAGHWVPGQRWWDIGEDVVAGALRRPAITVAATTATAVAMTAVLIPVGIALFGVALLAAAVEPRLVETTEADRDV